MTTSRTDFLKELNWRDQLKECTDELALGEHLASADLSKGGRRAYVGFDPTADSLTIGNLVGIIALKRWQEAGHTPVVVMGGGTGLIGDPSGKSAERQLRTQDEVAANVQMQRRIFENILDFSESRPNRAILVNNIEWLGSLSYLEALRDVGKHFSVNMMIQKDSVRERLNSREQGISYTEFSYMILQAYDFYHLYRRQNVSVQMGGSDQFGNIVVGADLIRRLGATTEPAVAAKASCFGLTWPLVTKADGTKFGKTESGAVWLTAKQSEHDASVSRTSVYAFYQFWLNAADADVIRFLKTFSFLTRDEVARLEHAVATDPSKREAQRALAADVTRTVHGAAELEKAIAATAVLFGKKSADGTRDDAPFILPEDILSSAPNSSHDKALLAGVGISLVDLLPQTSLAKSKTEARTLLSQNSISVNGKKAAIEARLTTASLISSSSPTEGIIALKRGSKTWHITRWK